MPYKILFSILSRPQQYLDPGTGSMLVQIIIAAIAAGGGAIAIFWKQIKAFFTGKKVSDDEAFDPTAVDEEALDEQAEPADDETEAIAE